MTKFSMCYEWSDAQGQKSGVFVTEAYIQPIFWCGHFIIL